ncbi:MAG: CapA family protein [Bacteroidetes bacterium]|nr:CapA family protein [Bacteroidota bacterium]
MKKLLIVFVFLVVSFFFLSINSQNSVLDSAQNDSTTVRISIVGDLMCHTPEMEFAKAGRDSFDFKPMFDSVKKYFSASDLTFGNLETTISGKEKKYSGYPLFNSPDAFLTAIKDAGFNVLFTANNHTLDRGTQGILRTLHKIHENGMSAVGTYHSEQDRDSIRIFSVKGIKIAVLAYTYGLNGNYLPPNKKFMVSIIDTSLIRKNIASARKKSADIVMVYFHFGEEYQRKPNSYQKRITAYTEKYGVDIIIGSHPHVIQPIEFFPIAANKDSEGLIAYSLGNFISNQRWRYSDSGVILNIEIAKSKSTGETRISNVTFVPTWVFKGKVGERNKFIVLPSDTSKNPIPAYLSKSDRAKLIQSCDDVRETFQAVTYHFQKVLNERNK